MKKIFTIVITGAMIMNSCRKGNEHAAPEGFENVSPPQVAYAELAVPQAIASKVTMHIDSIPLGHHGFVFGSDRNPVTSSFEILGTVADTRDGQITLKTQEKGNFTMRYALPSGMAIPATTGNLFKISYRTRLNDARFGYILVNTSGEKLLHSSVRLQGQEPLRVTILKDLEVIQAPANKEPSRTSDVMQLPVRVRAAGTERIVDNGKPILINYRGTPYTFLLLASMLSRDMEPASEGEGYALEFVLIRQ